MTELEIFKKFKSELQKLYAPEIFESWLKQIEFVAKDDFNVILSVKSDLFKDTLKSNLYFPDISECYRKFYPGICVEIVTREEKAKIPLFHNLQFTSKPFEMILDKITEEQKKMQEIILSNRLNNIEEIKYYLGVFKGLESAKNITAKFIKDNFNVN